MINCKPNYACRMCNIDCDDFDGPSKIMNIKTPMCWSSIWTMKITKLWTFLGCIHANKIVCLIGLEYFELWQSCQKYTCCIAWGYSQLVPGLYRVQSYSKHKGITLCRRKRYTFMFSLLNIKDQNWERIGGILIQQPDLAKLQKYFPSFRYLIDVDKTMHPLERNCSWD